MSPELKAALDKVPGLKFSEDGTQVIGPVDYDVKSWKVFQATGQNLYLYLSKSLDEKITHSVIGTPTLIGGFPIVRNPRILAVYDPPITLKEFLKNVS